MNIPKELNCPTCKKKILWNEDYPHRPFCSHRCQLIDLGEWASESYSIPDNGSDQAKEEWE
ncbi:MAG: DNA gyrase inhibitor YacG [Cellvibrionaceae bacterium]